MTHVIAAVGVALVVVSTGDVTLRQRVVSTTPLTLDHVIVGRARCGASTWVLIDAPALVEVTAAAQSPPIAPVRGFSPNEHPWGLACVADSELWTLADYRTLARLSFSGEIIRRTKLRQPRLNVFGVGELLVLQQPPAALDVPLLAAARLADVNRTRPWPGPTALPQAATKVDVPSGLVACGLGYQTWLPCWIASQPRIIVSDGAPTRTTVVQPQFLADTALDRGAPVWDVAIAPSVLWVLTSAVSLEAGRRVGARITKTTRRGESLGSIELRPRGRLIVSATDRAVLVLTAAGTVVEVAAP